MLIFLSKRDLFLAWCLVWVGVNYFLYLILSLEVESEIWGSNHDFVLGPSLFPSLFALLSVLLRFGGRLNLDLGVFNYLTPISLLL